MFAESQSQCGSDSDSVMVSPNEKEYGNQTTHSTLSESLSQLCSQSESHSKPHSQSQSESEPERRVEGEIFVNDIDRIITVAATTATTAAVDVKGSIDTMIGSDCMGEIFTFLTLAELGSVIVRISKQWKHIVETSMPKRNDECEFDLCGTSYASIMAYFNRVESPISRRHIGTVSYCCRGYGSIIMSTHEESIFVSRLVSSLRGLSNLHTLQLRYMTIQPGGLGNICDALCHHPSLTHLEVGGCNIEDKDADSLGQFIESNRVVTKLKIDPCAISSRGIEIFLPTLRHNTTLSSLSLAGFFLHPTAVHMLAQVLSMNTSLTELSLCRCSTLFPDDVTQLCQSIAKNESLKSIGLSMIHSNGASGQALSEMIRHNSTITQLDISSNWLGAQELRAILKAITTNSTIRTLNIDDNDLAGEAISALADMLTHNSTLTDLNLWLLSKERNEWDIFLNGLRHNHSITKIGLQHDKITMDELRSLVSMLTDSNHPSSIKSISLASCQFRDDDSLDPITDLIKHRNCHLTSLSVTPLEITSSGLSAILSALHDNTSLRVLKLMADDLRFTTKLGDQLIALAQSNTTLTQLTLPTLAVPNGIIQLFHTVAKSYTASSSYRNVDLLRSFQSFCR